MVASSKLTTVLVSILVLSATADTMPHAPSASCLSFLHSTCGVCKEAGKELDRRQCVLSCIESQDTSNVCAERIVKMKAKAACYDFIRNSCADCATLVHGEMKQCVSTCLAAKDPDNVCESVHRADQQRPQRQRPEKGGMQRFNGNGNKKGHWKRQQKAKNENKDTGSDSDEDSEGDKVVEWKVPQTDFPENSPDVPIIRPEMPKVGPPIFEDPGISVDKPDMPVPDEPETRIDGPEMSVPDEPETRINVPLLPNINEPEIRTDDEAKSYRPEIPIINQDMGEIVPQKVSPEQDGALPGRIAPAPEVNVDWNAPQNRIPETNVNQHPVDKNLIGQVTDKSNYPKQGIPNPDQNVAVPEQNVKWDVPQTRFPDPNVAQYPEMKNAIDGSIDGSIPGSTSPEQSIPDPDTGVAKPEQNEENVVSRPEYPLEDVDDAVRTINEATPECGIVCAIYCPLGNIVDEYGCPTCACRTD